MTRGLYLSTAGMMAQERRVESAANNLANANTLGYHRDVPAVRSFHLHLLHSNPTAGGPVRVTEAPAVPDQLPSGWMSLDLRPGSVRQTGRALDLAIDGDAFFTVAGSTGPRHTRAGNFQVSHDGTLVTPSGEPVLGQSGPIVIRGTRVEVSQEGMVTVDGRPVDRLRLVRLAAPGTAKVGATQLSSASPQPPGPGVRVLQGALTASNVSPIHEMTALIAATRAYETGQKLLQTQDQTLERAVNDVGRG